MFKNILKTFIVVVLILLVKVGDSYSARTVTSGTFTCTISADEKANGVNATFSSNTCSFYGEDFYRAGCIYDDSISCPSGNGANQKTISCSTDSTRNIIIQCYNNVSCPASVGYNEKIDSYISGCDHCESGLKVAYNGVMYKCCNDGDTLDSGTDGNCSSYSDICPHTPEETGTFKTSDSCNSCVEGALVLTGDAASRGGTPGQDFYCECVANSTWTPAENKCICDSGYQNNDGSGRCCLVGYHWDSGSFSCVSDCVVGSWTNTSEFSVNSNVCEMKQTRTICPSGTEDQWITATDQNSCCGAGEHWGGTSCVPDCTDTNKGGFGQEDKCNSSCNSTLTENSNAGICGCNEGYRGLIVGGSCSICSAGSYRTGWTSAGTLCPTCPVNTWSYVGSGSCTACTGGRESAAGSTGPEACACPSVTPLWNGSACVACPSGEVYSDGACWKISDKDLTCFKDENGNCDFGEDILDASSLGILYKYLTN